jgi:hypothetical protein
MRYIMIASFEQLKQMVLAAEDDVKRAAGGNKAAGTRVRKLMQDVKNAAQSLRVKILEDREPSAPGSGPGSGPGSNPGTPAPGSNPDSNPQ